MNVPRDHDIHEEMQVMALPVWLYATVLIHESSYEVL